MQNSKLFCTIAGSGVVLGLLSYFQSEKKIVQTSWTTNFTPSVKWDYNWDKREVSSLVRPLKENADERDQNRVIKERQNVTPIADRHILLVRHGQYNLFSTQDADRHLTELGREQAELTGLRLKSLNISFSRIVQSTMTRAKETAAIIHKHLPAVPIESCDMLREGAPIPSEPQCGNWKPELKQFHEDGARIEAAFRKYFHRADASQKKSSYELFVCHANVIRYFICRALQFPPEAWQRFALHNCSITWICIRPNGRVVVFAVGDSGHISPDKLTRT